MTKYKNKKCEFLGLKFDSKAERSRYIDLLDMQQRGLISDLTRQPRFCLLEKFTRHNRNFQAQFYIADFEYRIDERRIVEDVKGLATAVYKVKRKHFLKRNPDIEFLEVRLIGTKWEVTSYT